MGLASEMKNLSEELLASFKQRIKDNEELVNDVQKTLDGFHKDHLEMAAVLNANAADLKKGLVRGEKERLNTFRELMTGIHHTISSIQKEVVAIKTSTINIITEFTTDRVQMADGLDKLFAQGRATRNQNEKIRIKEFDALMKDINDDIKCINDEVLMILKNTTDMIDRFEKEHLEMSAGLRMELSKNLAERVEYTRTLLNGFQKRISEINKENQNMAQKLRKDLASGEADRLSDYHDIMKGINEAIKGIRKEVRDIQKDTAGMLDDLLQNRVQASAEWSNMQDTMTQIRETGVVSPPKQVVRKAGKKEAKKEAKVVPNKEIPVKEESALNSFSEEPKTLEQKVLDYISKHPEGVKISEMEEPLGKTRMKLGFTAKGLLDEGKVLKIENIYYPKPK